MLLLCHVSAAVAVMFVVPLGLELALHTVKTAWTALHIPLPMHRSGANGGERLALKGKKRRWNY